MDSGPLLFVYGTLRKGSAHPLAGLLATQGWWRGTATAAGRLHDLGAYPGMTEPAAAGEEVRGDVYELRDPDATLAVLDDYEGCGASQSRTWLYERLLAPVVLDGGDQRTAWVYYYRGSLDGARHLPGGDYLAAAPDDTGSAS